MIARARRSCCLGAPAAALGMHTLRILRAYVVGAGLASLLLLARGAGGQPASTARDSAPDVLYVNARIWTGDSTYPSAQALAVRGDRLVSVGSDAVVRALRGPKTRVVDLAGQRVVPGFIDAHWHLPTQARADLTDAGSPAVIVRRLRDWARTLPPGAWVVGRGWTPSDFPGNAPDRQFLDAAFPDRPVILTDRDGHQSLVNSVALARAGVTRTTADPPRGRIERSADGTPTGLLKEAASSLVSSKVPPPTTRDIAQRLDEQTRRAASFGLTMLQEASAREPSGAVFDALERASANGTLRVRFLVSVPFTPGVTTDALRRYVTLRNAHRGTMLRYGIAKGMLDGTVDAKTAAMLAPYAGTDDTGLPFWPVSALNRGVALYDSAGLQIQLHVRSATRLFAWRSTRIRALRVPTARRVGVIAWSTSKFPIQPTCRGSSNWA